MIKKGNPFKYFSAHKNRITSLNISSNDHFLVTSSIDGTFKLWSLENKYKPK